MTKNKWLLFAFSVSLCACNSNKTTETMQSANIPADSAAKIDTLVSSETEKTNSFLDSSKIIVQNKEQEALSPISQTIEPKGEKKPESQKEAESVAKQEVAVKPKNPMENDFPKFPTTPASGGGQAAPIKAPKISPVTEEAQKPAPKMLSHNIWEALTKKYVSADGKVNYAAIKKNKEQLETYLEILSENPPQANWDKNKQLAYWINAYNAFTIRRIVDKYPLSSINDIKPWDDKNISIGDKKYSLNQIENEIIRPQFKDPRIHFAVNCAAKSCPKILNEAFAPEKLNAQLEAQTKLFVNNTTENTLSEKKVEISRIFEWYKADFEAVGGVVPFLNKYANLKIKDNAKISYKEYNWNLNE